MNEYWCIPSKENAEFVACMEDILHIYSLPFNKDLPVVCMDEKPYQLLEEAREPLETRPGDTKKLDSEYVRCGTCSILSLQNHLPITAMLASDSIGQSGTGLKKSVIF